MDITELVSNTTVNVVLAALTTLAGLILSWQKIIKNAKKDQDELEAKILQEAKEEDAKLRSELEAKIDRVSTQVKTLERNINKDIEHLKESYSAEIKTLGEKIEVLRDELRNAHGQLVQLLTTVIEHSKKN